MFRWSVVSRAVRAAVLAATLAVGTVAVPVVAQRITPPSMAAASRLPTAPVQPTPAPRPSEVSNSMAMAKKRDAWIHLSTIAIVLGAILLVVLLV